MVKIKDVARLAGVSSATVSRVLSNRDPVSHSTRLKVQRAIQQLDYKPSRVARSLRVHSSKIIGLIISDIQNPFFISLVRAVEDFASKNQYAIFLCNSDEDHNKESFYVDLMIAEQVAGVIMTPTRETSNVCDHLLRVGIPVVAIDRRILDCDVDTVVLNNVHGAQELVTHLIENGHTRIGAIIGSKHITTGRERFVGYSLALKANDISYLQNYVKIGSPVVDTGFNFALELLSLEIPPTALFAGNNLLTFGALRAIQTKGLKIPDDVSLVGFDDPDWATLVQPRLTVAAQPTYEMGRLASLLISQRIIDPARPYETIVLESELKIRESVLRIN